MEFTIDKERIYKEDENGKLIAEITFPEEEPGVYNIDHTFVDDSLRGQGIAGQLMEAAVAEIKRLGGSIKATCSYSVVWLEKNPQEDMDVELPDGLACKIDGKH